MDCSVVRCGLPTCNSDEIAVLQPGNCCEECVPDTCENSMSKPKCIGCETCPYGYNDGCNECSCDKNGQEICTLRACLINNEPYCKPDCNKPCKLPKCMGDQIPITLPGKCCPECVSS